MREKHRVAICNERFLARFGVDRILVLLAEHLAALGHEITFMCIRGDLERLRSISDRIEILDPPNEANLLQYDGLACSDALPRLRRAGIDIVVSGGWPFFETAALASSLGARSVFIDAGAVPHDGFPDDALPIQRELRRLREMTLPDIDLVMPISHFIEESQTLPDRGSSEGVHMVHLGADHLSRRPLLPPDESESALLGRLDDLCSAGIRLVLSLGRMEPFGYKRSHVVFDLLHLIIEKQPKVKLLILVGSEPFDVPGDIREHVLALPAISDAALQAIMQKCVVGLSPSLWEGFNLPIAEMQWLGRPVLAFGVGAHPEIIADPWFLCQSDAEMAEKAIEIIADGVPTEITTLARLETFRDRFTWDKTLERWTDLIVSRSRRTQKPGGPLIIVDVTNSARDPANSGVIRVTRRLTAELVKRSDLTVLFAKWSHEKGDYALLSGVDHGFLSSNSGPVDWIGRAVEASGSRRSLTSILQSLVPWSGSQPMLLLPEVILDGAAEDRVRWAKSNRCATAFIFHDMLPIFAADLVSREVAAAFPAYLAALGASGAMLANSHFSLSEYERWHGDRNAISPRHREAIWLPAQLGNRPRVRTHRTPRKDPVELLCVSTIEPRKNHAVLVEAFKRLMYQIDVPLLLNLVGNSYAGEHGLSDWVRSVCAAEPAIVWHGIVSDELLVKLYDRARFTIYPSLAEGFGLPIMESLWMGRPCICYAGGVMSELAAAGGCMTVDMTDADSLAAGMAALLADDDLYDRLCREARERELKDWQDYGSEIAARLVTLVS